MQLCQDVAAGELRPIRELEALHAVVIRRSELSRDRDGASRAGYGEHEIVVLLGEADVGSIKVRELQRVGAGRLARVRVVLDEQVAVDGLVDERIVARTADQHVVAGAGRKRGGAVGAFRVTSADPA